MRRRCVWFGEVVRTLSPEVFSNRMTFDQRCFRGLTELQCSPGPFSSKILRLCDSEQKRLPSCLPWLFFSLEHHASLGGSLSWGVGRLSSLLDLGVAEKARAVC